MLSSLNAQQRGAVYILFGAVVSAVGRALEPGILFDGVDWHDLEALTTTLHDNSFLTHLSSVLYAFGLMFVITGLNSVRKFVTDDGLVGDMVRGGTVLGMVSLLVLALNEGLDHMTVRVLDDGIGSNSMDVAVSVQSVKLGVVLLALPVLYTAIGVAGLGGTRLLPAGPHRMVTGFAALVMLATGVLLLTAAALESHDFWSVVQGITAVVLAIWIVTLAHAEYKGKISPSVS